MKSKKYLSLIFAIAFCLAVVLFDQLSKYSIVGKFGMYGQAAFLPGFLGIQVIPNPGIGYGLLSKQPILVLVLTIVIISLFLGVYIWRYCMAKRPMSKTLGVAVGLISGGCFGNLYDRIAFGVVRDFLHFEFMNFPTFNIADVAICAGIAVLAVYLLFIYPKEQKAESASAEGQPSLEAAQVTEDNIEASPLTPEKEPANEVSTLENEEKQKPSTSKNEQTTDSKTNLATEKTQNLAHKAPQTVTKKTQTATKKAQNSTPKKAKKTTATLKKSPSASKKEGK